jgi:antitoxin MazE
MDIEFLKWGNSLALRIPKAFAQEIGAAEGTRGDLSVENGSLVIKIARRGKRRFDLEQLVEGITDENRHAEIDWGAPRGNESW